MSRWADTFARLSSGSDTLDTMRHSGETPPQCRRVSTVSQQPPRLPWTPRERANGRWREGVTAPGALTEAIAHWRGPSSLRSSRSR
jgi:hypothetical protein